MAKNQSNYSEIKKTIPDGSKESFARIVRATSSDHHSRNTRNIHISNNKNINNNNSCTNNNDLASYINGTDCLVINGKKSQLNYFNLI